MYWTCSANWTLPRLVWPPKRLPLRKQTVPQPGLWFNRRVSLLNDEPHGRNAVSFFHGQQAVGEGPAGSCLRHRVWTQMRQHALWGGTVPGFERDFFRLVAA